MSARTILSEPIRLPPPFGRRLDRLADGLMYPSGTAVDFALPHGEPALATPHSVSWRVFKNPVALFIGGVAAVLLELAEPRVRDGVWQHSSFRLAPLTRLQRTGLAAMMTVYGPRSQAEAMIAGVVRAHGRVTGITTDGQPYHANDPELLRWVQATASFGFLTAYSRFVRPLSRAEMDRGIAEAAPNARLYGVVAPMGSLADMEALFAEMDARLVPSPVIGMFLQIMREVEAFPWPLRPLQRIMLKAAASLLPEPLRDRLELGRAWRLRGWERLLVKAAGRASDRLVLPTAPPAQACRRLGLPADWLYRCERRR